MADPIVTPMLVGAGVGALGGLITGRDPLKSAALGGVLGAGGSAVGAWGSGQAAATGASSIAPTTASAFESSMGLPSSAFIQSGGDIGTALAGRIPTEVIPSSSNLFALEDLKPYLNVRDLTGAAQVAAQYQQRPQMPQAPAGGIQRGQAPQGSDVMSLIASMKQPERRRISLV